MALPTIVFNTSTGSDTQASGAGPATALFGTTDASTDGTGLIVTVTAGTDLSGVATDGSHVIFLNDTTAGNRNFGKITGTAGSGGATPTVTVSDAFGLSLTTKSWAIGGKRNLLSATTSAKLAENNAAAGDAMPGWTIEFTDGQTQTFTAVLNWRRAGNNTDGPITIRTTPGFTTRTILTWNSNTVGFHLRASGLHFVDLQFENTNGTKTAAMAFDNTTGNTALILRIKCANSTNKWGRFINNSNQYWRIINCEVGYCTLSNPVGLALFVLFMGNWVHDNTGSGAVTCNNTSCLAIWNLITNNTGNGIGGLSNGVQCSMVIGNTIDGSSGDGINGPTGTSGAVIVNNLVTNCGDNGVEIATDTLVKTQNLNCYVDGNNANGNATAPYAPVGLGLNDPNVAPSYINTGALNWGVGAALAAVGFPLSDFPGSTTHSYMDIGAAQRVASSGGAGGSFAFS